LILSTCKLYVHPNPSHSQDKTSEVNGNCSFFHQSVSDESCFPLSLTILLLSLRFSSESVNLSNPWRQSWFSCKRKHVKPHRSLPSMGEPATIEKCNELSKQLFYTRLASIPGRTETFWKEVNHVKGLWKNRQDLKVEDAGIAAIFGLEVFCWFCAGEIVGRGFTFTGYNV
ncbi:hypothetical protein MKW98_030731, partial [Papaver atlanticum]